MKTETIKQTIERIEQSVETLARTRDLLRACGVQTPAEDTKIDRYEMALNILRAARGLKGASRREAISNATRMIVGGES